MNERERERGRGRREKKNMEETMEDDEVALDR